MNNVCAASRSLILILEQTPSRRWKTTVRSSSNPDCVYVSTHLYERVDEAKAAAVRIAGYAWGERLNGDELIWRFGPGTEEDRPLAAAALTGT